MAEDPKEFLRRLSAKQVADMQAAAERRRLEQERKRAAQYQRNRQPPPAENETDAAQWVRENMTWEEHPELWVPKFCSWSDYVGGSLEKSNGKALIRDFPDLFKEGHGGYNTVWVGMPEDKRLTLADDAWENLRSVIEGLADYPVIDEELMSEMEWEGKTEDWQHYGRNSMREELIKKFGHDADAQIAVVAKRNEFWDRLWREKDWDQWMEEEPGGTWAFHEERAVREMDRDELVVPAEVEAVKKAVFSKHEDKLARALQNAGVDVMNGQHLWEMFQYAEHVLTPLGMWEVNDKFFKEDAEVDPLDHVEIVDLDDVVRVLTEPEAQQKALRKHWANDPRQLKLPGYESLAQALVASLLEAEASDFEKYYEQYGAKLVDKIEDSGYEASLWHYASCDLYEVNIGYGGADWTNPATHTSGQYRGKGMFPRSVLKKIQEWIGIRGHLTAGTHNPHRLGVYKRLLQRATGAKIVDVPWAVPGGGAYFLAITTDEDVLRRVAQADEKRGLGESLAASLLEVEDPKDIFRRAVAAVPFCWEVDWIDRNGQVRLSRFFVDTELQAEKALMLSHEAVHSITGMRKVTHQAFDQEHEQWRQRTLEAEDPKDIFKKVTAAAPKYVIAGLSRRGFNVYYYQKKGRVGAWTMDLWQGQRFTKEQALAKMDALRASYPTVSHRVVMRVVSDHGPWRLANARNEAEDPKEFLRRASEVATNPRRWVGNMPKKVEIWGKRWFNRTYGNTYFTARIYVDDQLVHTMPEEYGYGDHYADRGFEWLEQNGYIPERTRHEARMGSYREVPWQWAQQCGFQFLRHAEDVRRRRDLF